jgi:hypothetical protein
MDAAAAAQSRQRSAYAIEHRSSDFQKQLEAQECYEFPKVTSTKTTATLARTPLAIMSTFIHLYD